MNLNSNGVGTVGEGNATNASIMYNNIEQDQGNIFNKKGYFEDQLKDAI